MGRRRGDQRRPFYEFHLVDRVPKNYLLRRINVFVTAALADCTRSLSRITATTAVPRLIPDGNPNANRGGYCYGIRSERRLCEEIGHLTYRWFCRSTSMIRSRITRRCRSIGSGTSARATSCATSSSASCVRRCHRPREG